MWIPLVLAIGLLFQGAPAHRPDDALSLLNDVAQRYARAESYRIEATQERTFTGELSRSWQKTILTAMVSPGGRYRYEGRSDMGSAVMVSDGATEWIYHVYQHLYTQKPVAGTVATPGRMITQQESTAQDAKVLATQLRAIPRKLKSATLLPEETIEVHGLSVHCYVVRYSDSDLKTRSADYKTEETIWIDKARMVIVKTARHAGVLVRSGGSDVRIPASFESITMYTVVDIDRKQPDSVFSFSPPADAKLVESFPDPFRRAPDIRAGDFVGKPAPNIHIKNSDGKITDLSSFHGKPLFIDFWATGCAPCVKVMPDLKKLYAETAAKGLAWISIDNDEDPDTATKYVAAEQIPWPNYHDADGLLGKAFGREGIPLGILIGADGTVRFYQTGYSISELRSAISNLGPEFSAVTPAAPDPR